MQLSGLFGSLLWRRGRGNPAEGLLALPGRRHSAPQGGSGSVNAGGLLLPAGVLEVSPACLPPHPSDSAAATSRAGCVLRPPARVLSLSGFCSCVGDPSPRVSSGAGSRPASPAASRPSLCLRVALGGVPARRPACFPSPSRAGPSASRQEALRASQSPGSSSSPVFGRI